MTPTQRSQTLRNPSLLIPWIHDKHFVLVIIGQVQNSGQAQTRQQVLVVDPLGGDRENSQVIADLERTLVSLEGVDDIQQMTTGLQKGATLDCGLWVLAACQYFLAPGAAKDSSAVIAAIAECFL